MRPMTSDRLRPEVTKTSSMYPTELGIGSVENSCRLETEIATIKYPLFLHSNKCIDKEKLKQIVVRNLRLTALT